MHNFCKIFIEIVKIIRIVMYNIILIFIILNFFIDKNSYNNIYLTLFTIF
jgi:hypothetical protein